MATPFRRPPYKQSLATQSLHPPYKNWRHNSYTYHDDGDDDDDDDMIMMVTTMMTI